MTRLLGNCSLVEDRSKKYLYARAATSAEIGARLAISEVNR